MKRLVFLLACVGLLAASPAAAGSSSHEPPSAEADHGAAHGAAAHEPQGFGDLNLFYGVLGEKEGVEPGLLWRPPGMGVPYGVMVFNTLVLFGLFYRYGRRPLREALRQRKESITRGMSEAGQMKRDAEKRLAAYQDKLQHLDDEVERVKTELRAAGEAERKRILEEARGRRARIERDARQVVALELKAAIDDLKAGVVREAAREARAQLRRQLTPADQQRLAEDYLGRLDRAFGERGARP